MLVFFFAFQLFLLGFNTFREDFETEKDLNFQGTFVKPDHTPETSFVINMGFGLGISAL